MTDKGRGQNDTPLSDRERLVEIFWNNGIKPNEPLPSSAELRERLADAIIAAGFGDVAAKDKRIAELEALCIKHNLLPYGTANSIARADDVRND